jgi:hypothetical protein
MRYKFQYKRRWFWKTVEVMGHRYDEKSDRMDLHLPSGAILSIGEWRKHSLKLGTDWVLATKSMMESESGQDVKLKVEK